MPPRTPATRSQSIIPPAESPTAPANRPELDQAAEFRSWLDRKRLDAERQVADLSAEIEHLETTIRARMNLRAEYADILERCTAALGAPAAPQP